MGRVEQYRVELRKLTEWEPYLKKNSGLPGARANLELVEAVGEEADPELLWRLSASSDEFLKITKSLAATSSRKGEDFRVLKQALGYCWSVAAAAEPEAGRPLMEKWLRSPDKDVAWVIQSNLGKARIGALGSTWVTKWHGRTPAGAGAAEAKQSASTAAGKPIERPARKTNSR